MVGVIANLTLWFVLHVLFRTGSRVTLGPLNIELPDLASFDWRAGLLASLAMLLIFRLRWGVIRVLAVCAAGGLLLSAW